MFFKIKSIPMLAIGATLLAAILVFLFVFVPNAQSITNLGKGFTENSKTMQKAGRIFLVIITVIISSLAGILVTRSISKSALFMIPAAIGILLLFLIGRLNITETVPNAVPFAVFAFGSYILASLWMLFIIMRENGYSGFLLMGFAGLALLILGVVLYSSFGYASKSGVVRLKSFLDFLPFVLMFFGALFFLVGWFRGIITVGAWIISIFATILLYTIGMALYLFSEETFYEFRSCIAGLTHPNANDQVEDEDEE